MAEVTVNTVKRNVEGSLRVYYYNINGNSGDTITLGFNSVKIVNTEIGGLVTGYSVAAGTNPGTSVVTLTSSAPMVGVDVEVVGN